MMGKLNNDFKIFMDARLMFYAGVGRYQRELLINIFKNKEDIGLNKNYAGINKKNHKKGSKINRNETKNLKFFILGDKNKINDFIISNDLPFENFIVINNKAKKYSFLEQVSLSYVFLKYRKKVNLFFFPHFNISIFYIPKNSVVTVHDLTYFHYSKYFGIFKAFAAKLLLQRVLKKTKKIITVSNFVKQDIINMFGYIKSVDLKNKIKVIYEGHNSIFNQKSISDDKEVFHRKDNFSIRPYILYLGNRKKHKNILGLIKTYKIVKKDDNFKDLELILIGSKFKKVDFIDKFIKKEKISGVIQLSNLKDEEIRSYYSNALAFTFFSISEGFGLAPLEAAASGAPLILANAGALPEVFKNAAIFVDPLNELEMANAIKKVISDEKFRNELKKSSFELAKRYSSEKMAFETLNYFKI